MSFTTRAASLADIFSICALVNSAYRGDYSKQGWTTEADILGGQRTDPVTLEKEMTAPGCSIELLLENLRLIGCVFLKDEESSLYFGMLTIEPTRQGEGLAKILLNRIDAIAKEKKKSSIRLTVIDTRSELIAYYERRGYKATGETEPFPEHDPAFGIQKQKLTFLVYQKNL